jgi:hypothetical protein
MLHTQDPKLSPSDILWSAACKPYIDIPDLILRQMACMYVNN